MVRKTILLRGRFGNHRSASAKATARQALVLLHSRIRIGRRDVALNQRIIILSRLISRYADVGNARRHEFEFAGVSYPGALPEEKPLHRDHIDGADRAIAVDIRRG